MKPHLLEMTADEVRRAVEAAGQKAYRAGQLADWVYAKGVTDPKKMSNLPAAVTEIFDILTSRVAARSPSSDGTLKLLLELSDGEHAETVVIPSEKRVTACLSTQVGCAMGCTFCASGMDGLKRNMSAGEILEQLLHLRQEGGEKITNVVFMGMGEPLANYDATLAAVKAIIDPERFGISARRVTVSTVGLPKQIRRLAAEDLPVTLAISLHSPNDALRRQHKPAASKYPIDSIIAAARQFYEARNREITLEYALLGGVNDSSQCAEQLAQIAHSLRCNVNLIRYNSVETLPYEPPSQAAVTRFAEKLARSGINANIRRSRGQDAEAACGQLRRRATERC